MYFTPDWAGAKGSVRNLAALAPEIVITGHCPYAWSRKCARLWKRWPPTSTGWQCHAQDNPNSLETVRTRYT
jgi:hypothetical protein